MLCFGCYILRVDFLYKATQSCFFTPSLSLWSYLLLCLLLLFVLLRLISTEKNKINYDINWVSAFDEFDRFVLNTEHGNAQNDDKNTEYKIVERN